MQNAPILSMFERECNQGIQEPRNNAPMAAMLEWKCDLDILIEIKAEYTNHMHLRSYGSVIVTF
jgi:hypothetical protein